MKKSAAKKAATRTTATTPAPAAGSVSARSDRTAAAPAGASDAPAAGSKTRATRSEARARSARATSRHSYPDRVRGRGRRAGAHAGRAGDSRSCTADRRGVRGQGSDDGEASRHQDRRRPQAGEGHPQRRGDREDPGRAGGAAGRAPTEYDQTLSEITELQRDRLTDSAGDDQADTGTKTFEREQEISLANSILERISQVERALERLDEGGYGWCERCGNPIPVERLAAFPSATLCVTCKQLEERR